MAVRGRRAADDGRAARDEVLVRVGDLAGRPRGTGFVADHHGTVVTSHEAVDGLARIVLHGTGDRTCVVSSDAVTPLPALDLALIRTEGLCVDPLPFTVREHVETGTYVRIAAGGWPEARVLGTAEVTYTATDGLHLLGGVLELAIGTAGSDALRLGGGAAEGPVLDTVTGTVVGVLGTALEARHRTAGFAVPLRGRQAEGPLAELLARNAATVPAYGADLNLAGVLELTATSVGSDGPGAGSAGASGADPVERADAVREFAAFAEGPAAVLGLVGPPGSGRTTELAALTARRARGPEPAPTLWLRGADLLDGDESVADAARRALERAGRIVLASDQAEEEGGRAAEALSAEQSALPGRYGGELGDIRPERLARLALAEGRPLLLLLDDPEEMPPPLAHRLPEWTDGTARWLRENGARLVVACRAEYWERAGDRFPAELLHGTVPEGEGRQLPPRVRPGDLTEAEARRARLRYGIPEGALDGADARHPLTLRLLSEVRAALPERTTGRPGEDGAFAGPPGGCRPGREEVLSAYLDLMCPHVAVRLAAGNGMRGTAVRRLAAQVAGQVHEAARRCLGPGQGELDRAAFEAVFPWGPMPGPWLGGTTGWASAVLTEGLLVPAVSGAVRRELLDLLIATDRDPSVLDMLLRAAAARGATADIADHAGTRLLVHRIGMLLVRTPEGAPASTGPSSTSPGTSLRGAGGGLAQRDAAGVGGRRGSEHPPHDREPGGGVGGTGGARSRVSRGRCPGRSPCDGSQPGCRCGRRASGMAPLDLRMRQTRTRVRLVFDEERSQCSAGVAWRTSPRTGGAASSPSVPTTGCTAGTS